MSKIMAGIVMWGSVVVASEWLSGACLLRLQKKDESAAGTAALHMTVPVPSLSCSHSTPRIEVLQSFILGIIIGLLLKGATKAISTKVVIS